MSIASEITRLQGAKADIKSAIEAKGVTVPSSAKLDTYDDYIAQITGGSGAVTEKLLNFYDYDGTLVQSYGGSEIQSLSALPTAPDHSTDWCPLTFQAWNWSLADIKSYNNSYPNVVINVSGIYIPTDNNTHLKFRIGEYDTSGVQFTITTTGGTVNWGDGTSETISSTTLSHVYSNAGDYDCTLTGITSLVMYSSTAGNQKYFDKLIEARIGSSVTSISETAFRQCHSLTSITIPSSVTSIGNYGFYYCCSLTSITIPSSVTSIGNYGFSQCFSLTSMTIPNSITIINQNTFHQCFSLTSITIPSSVTSINWYAFQYCYSLISIAIPSSVTNIDNYAFNYCFPLRSLTISSGVTRIGNDAFEQCFSLTSITIPSSVTSIGNSAFTACYSLTSITIPSSVTSIGNSAFSNCFSLTSMTIPSSVTSMGTNEFSNCYSIVALIMEGTTPPTIKSTTLNAYLKHIYVPSSAVNTYQSASNWSNYASIIEAIPS